MIIFTILINSDIDVLFSISSSQWEIHRLGFKISSWNDFSKIFRRQLEWFFVILISSAFSSVPELDSRKRNPLASSWHNDSLTKVSRKRFQNHRKLIQTHPLQEHSSSNQWFQGRNELYFTGKLFKLVLNWAVFVQL